MARVKVDRVKDSFPPDGLLGSSREGEKLCFGAAGCDRALFSCFPIDWSLVKTEHEGLGTAPSVWIVGE